MKTIELKDLMKAGLHFGHKPSSWNPKMESFLFGIKAGVHVINLEKTKEYLEKAAEFVRSVAGQGGTILYIGTKPQAKKIIEKQALKVEMPYVNERWFGGTITNFTEIHKLIKKMQDLVSGSQLDDYEQKYTKKERLVFSEEIKKLEKGIGGIANMTKLPDAVFIASIREEKTAVSECIKLNIPIVGVCDSNANPNGVKHIIPANDDAVKSIEFVVSYITDAIEIGKREHKELEKNKPIEVVKTKDKK
ncbi:MAG: 30S ribosomal protein S2 [Patescibacteria group bacterium]